jgi:hypothetical protein
MSAYEQYQKQHGIKIPRRVSGSEGREEAQAFKEAEALFSDLQNQMAQNIGTESGRQGQDQGSVIGFGKPDALGRPTYKRVVLPEGRGSIFNAQFQDTQDKTIKLSINNLFKVEASRLSNLHKRDSEGIRKYTNEYAAYSKSVIDALDDTRTENALTVSATYIGQVGLADITNYRETAEHNKTVDTNEVLIKNASTTAFDLASKGLMYRDDDSLTVPALSALADHMSAIAHLKILGVQESVINGYDEKFMATQDYGNIIHLTKDEPNSVLYRAGMDYMNGTSNVLEDNDRMMQLSEETRITIGSSLMALARQNVEDERNVREEKLRTARDQVRAFKKGIADFTLEKERPPNLNEIKSSLDLFGISSENHYLHTELIISVSGAAIAGDKAAGATALALYKDVTKSVRQDLTRDRIEGKDGAMAKITAFAETHEWITLQDGSSVPDNETDAWYITELAAYHKDVNKKIKDNAKKSVKIAVGIAYDQVAVGERSVASVEAAIDSDKNWGTDKEAPITTALRDKLSSMRTAERALRDSPILAKAKLDEEFGNVLDRAGANALLKVKRRAADISGTPVDMMALAIQWKRAPTQLSQIFENALNTRDSKKAFDLVKEWKTLGPVVQSNSFSHDVRSFYEDVESFERLIGTDPERYFKWIEERSKKTTSAEEAREITEKSWARYDSLPQDTKMEFLKTAYRNLDYNQYTSLVSSPGSDFVGHPDQLAIWPTLFDPKIFDYDNIPFENSGEAKADFEFIFKMNLKNHANILDKDPGNPEQEQKYFARVMESTVKMLAEGPRHYSNTFYSPTGRIAPDISDINWLGANINDLIDILPRWLNLGPEGSMNAGERMRTLVFAPDSIEGWVNKVYRSKGFKSITTRRAIIRALRTGELDMLKGLDSASKRMGQYFKPHEYNTFPTSPEHFHDSGNIKIRMIEGTWNDKGGPSFDVFYQHAMRSGADIDIPAIGETLIGSRWQPKAIMDQMAMEDKGLKPPLVILIDAPALMK